MGFFFKDILSFSNDATSSRHIYCNALEEQKLLDEARGVRGNHSSVSPLWELVIIGDDPSATCF